MDIATCFVAERQIRIFERIVEYFSRGLFLSLHRIA